MTQQTTKLRQHDEWKNDREFHALLLKLNDTANSDEEVSRLRRKSHGLNQAFLLASDQYGLAFNAKLRELYQENGIDSVCLDRSSNELEQRIAQRAVVLLEDA